MLGSRWFYHGITTTNHSVSHSLRFMYLLFISPTDHKCIRERNHIDFASHTGYKEHEILSSFPWPYQSQCVCCRGATSHPKPSSYSAHLQLVMSLSYSGHTGICPDLKNLRERTLWTDWSTVTTSSM